MKCGAEKGATCMARQGDQCMEHLITDTPSCPSRVPQTNADHIRTMSDEKLARFLAKVGAGLYRADLDVISYRGEKVNENLDWLKQEVSE